MISVNASFTGVVNTTTQLPILNVADLTANTTIVDFHGISTGTKVTNLEINGGHITTSQTLLPGISSFPSNVATLSVKSTDISGLIKLEVPIPPTSTATFTVTYSKSYLSSRQSVIVTPGTQSGAIAFQRGVHVTSTQAGFTIHVDNSSVAAIPTGTYFNYTVIDPIS